MRQAYQRERQPVKTTSLERETSGTSDRPLGHSAPTIERPQLAQSVGGVDFDGSAVGNCDGSIKILEHAAGGVGEGGNTLRVALVGQRVAAGPRQRSVGEGLLAGFGERDEHGGAESELAASAADDEPPFPASGAGRLDEQTQSVRNRDSLRQRESASHS